MATNPTPTQPGLPSFIVYDHIPEGCIVFEVPDNESLPHVRAGEFVVIDPEDRDPAEGELFVITWKSDIEQRWKIVQMEARFGSYGRGADPSEYEDRYRWFIGAVAPQRMMNLAGELAGPAQRWADGPYDDCYCREICHGKIVGIYKPDFRKQLREAA